MSRRKALIPVAAAVLVIASVLGVLAVRGGDGPRGWSAPEAVAGNQLTGEAVSAIAGDGTAVAVWTERVKDQWALMGSDRPLGGDWSAPTPIVGPQHWRVTGLVIAVDERGDAAVSFAYWGRGHAVLLGSYRAARGRWEAAQALAPTTSGFFQPSVALDAKGNATVAWVAGFGMGAPIFASGHSAAGWSDPVFVTRSSSFAAAPALSVGENGRTFVAMPAASGAPGRTHPRLAVFERGAAGAWSRLPDPAAITDGGLGPAIAVDSSGMPTVAWAQNESRGSSLMMRRWTGVNWGPPTVLDRGPRAGFGSLEARASGAGVVLAWARWQTRWTRVSVRAALTDGSGATGGSHALDSFTIPDIRGGATHTSPGPSPTRVLLAGSGHPIVLWDRLVTRTPTFAGELFSSALDAPANRWEPASRITPGPLEGGWPLAIQAGGRGKVATWARLMNPNGGPIEVYASERRSP